MTSVERERVIALCEQIKTEKDDRRFMELCIELAVLLERDQLSGVKHSFRSGVLIVAHQSGQA